jgi:hypothetical protein
MTILVRGLAVGEETLRHYQVGVRRRRALWRHKEGRRSSSISVSAPVARSDRWFRSSVTMQLSPSERLVCSASGNRNVDMAVSGTERR